MNAIMHNALQDCKRLLHYETRYSYGMESSDRLRDARIAAGYETAKDAAVAMGVPVSTYIGHENGTRGFPAKRAAQYARKFKVTEEWLLYGKKPVDTASEEMGELISYARVLDFKELRLLKAMAKEMADTRDEEAG